MQNVVIEQDWIAHAGSQALFSALERAGYQVFFVGGCVRNALLGEAVADIDLATDALPKDVAKVATDAGFKVIETGVAHGTLTVIAKGRAHEVTTFRQDIDTDGRHAVVAFSKDINADAARRDFTMNALYADCAGRVVDPLGGLDDLMARRLRFVGDAAQRIREDYLRILRFFRFYAQYGDSAEGPDPEALAACAAQLDGLDRLAKERIGAEMRKLLAAPDPAPALAVMASCGVLRRILSGADPVNVAPFLHIAAMLGVARDPIYRLAALGGADAPADLRLSRAETKRFKSLQKAAQEMSSPSEMTYRFGPKDGAAAYALRMAFLSQLPPDDVDAQLARGGGAIFPLKAHDLPSLSGKALGQRLREAEACWIASQFTMTHRELVTFSMQEPSAS